MKSPEISDLKVWSPPRLIKKATYNTYVTKIKRVRRTTAGSDFCDCVHVQANPLDSCLEIYEMAADDVISKK